MKHGLQFKQEAAAVKAATIPQEGQRGFQPASVRQTFAQHTDPDDRKTDARIGAIAGVSRETVRKMTYENL